MSMRVCLVSKNSPHLASFRMRTMMAAQAMARNGDEVLIGWGDANIYVFSKHFDPDDVNRASEAKEKGALSVFDVCDNHFGNACGDHYRRMIPIVDKVICSTEQLQSAINLETGVESSIIPEPYERPRVDAKKPEGRVLWFGHQSNLPTTVGYECDIYCRDWTFEGQTKAFEEHDIAIIPVPDTEKALAKSANRAVEALQAGLFVVAGHSPSHEELSPFIYMGEIGEGIAWAKAHPDEAQQMTRAGQAYISGRFSPRRIMALWEAELLSI